MHVRIRNIEAEENIKKQRVAKMASFSGLADEWEHLTADEKRAIVKIFIRSATVAQGHGKERLKIDWFV